MSRSFGLESGRECTDEQGFYHNQTNFAGRYRDLRKKIGEEFNFEDYDTIRIIDVGVSKGRAIDSMTSKWEEKGYGEFMSVGIDISREHVKEAADRENVDNGVNGRVEKLPVEDSSFDILVCNALLPYLPEDPEKLNYTDKNPHYLALQEFSRVLKPEGVAAVEAVDESPHEQLYFFEQEDIGRILNENSPDQSLSYPAGEEIEFRL